MERISIGHLQVVAGSAWTPHLQEFLAHYDETRPATTEQFQNVWVMDTGQQYNNSLKIHTFYMNLDKLISDRFL